MDFIQSVYSHDESLDMDQVIFLKEIFFLW